MLHHQRVVGHADETRFRKWADRPAVPSAFHEPYPGDGMVYVVGPGEGYWYVDAQQRCHGQSRKEL